MTDGGQRRGFPRSLALLGAGAMFMEILDATIVVTALPSIAADLRISTVEATSVVTAYLVTVAVLIPLSTWIAERFGTRRVCIAAMVLFTIASAGCALAPNLAVLVVMRVAQAAGGAMMVPLGRLVVLSAIDIGHLARAIAYLTWPALVAPVLAPACGGLIVEYSGWRMIFVINIPLGIIGVIAALRIFPRDVPTQPRRLDVIGVLGAMTAIGAAMVAAESFAAAPIRWPVVLIGVAVAGIIGLATVRHMRRAPDPLLNLSVLQVRSFSSVIGYGSVYRLAISAVPFALPLMLQVRFGWSPVAAGVMVGALFAGNMVIKPVTTPLMRRCGIRWVIVGAAGVSAVAFALLAAVGPTTPMIGLAVLLVVSGMARSVGFSAYNTLAFADVDESRLGDANAIHAAMQELGNAFGVALASVGIALLDPVSKWLPAGAYSAVFVALVVVMALCVLGALKLPARVGAHALG